MWLYRLHRRVVHVKATAAGAGGVIDPSSGGAPPQPPRVPISRSPSVSFPGPSQKPPHPPIGGGGGQGGAGGGPPGEGAGGGDGVPSEGNFLIRGWRDRVAADPEFPFKVLIEQVPYLHHT